MPETLVSVSSPFVRLEPECVLRGTDFALLLAAAAQRGVSIRFEASGSSMRPFLRPGDILTVAPVAPECLRIGDVMAFASTTNHRVLVHRLVWKQPAALIAKGDNVPRPDEPVAAGAVFGRVVAAERGGRRLRVGFGPERALLALLSRAGWLQPLMRAAARVRRLVRL